MSLKSAKETEKAAKRFVENWRGKGYEKGESQKFWIELLEQVFGVENAPQFVQFEDQVKLDKSTGFIDVMIPSTHVMIEQKSIEKDLRKGIKQSDGSMLTPFQQAKRYSAELSYSQRPRWIVTCNFREFLVYNMENPNGEPESILLENLAKEYYRLSFLVDEGNENLKREEEISIKAGEIVGRLYDALRRQYKNPENEQTQKSLNVLCVRLVFCFYAEDAGVFGRHLMFHDYLKDYETVKMRKALIDVFRILNTKIEDRDPYEDDDLAAFPYVNGGLFADDNIEIPQFTDEIRSLILHSASEDFDWSQISPTIFGAVFESTLNPETRRSGGMHYTSVENIHKVIDPLFLDDLKAEFESIKELKEVKNRNAKIEHFRQKLASLKFLDPACGSGNFLTETYISLRKLENEALRLKNSGQGRLEGFNDTDRVYVEISRFYGIEINDFAVTVAKTALWIAESQMLKETEAILQKSIDFLPLTTNAYIVEGNALRMDWNEVVPANELSYIMGNPPFVGARLMSKEQKEDLLGVFGKTKGAGDMDYVSCWYKKASDYMLNTKIETALVSTNSITQGEQPPIIWSALGKGLTINFAYRTFRWISEASSAASVYCVIIGFSYISRKIKYLFNESGSLNYADNINPYLYNAPSVLIKSRSKPLCNVNKLDFGSMPNDNGYLSNYSADEKNAIIAKYPKAEKLFKRILGADEFINGKERYCLWLKDISPIEYIDIPPICEAVKSVEETRKNSTREATKRLAQTPMLFGEIRQPNTDYLLIPSATTANRRYIPIGFIDKNIISTNLNLVLPNADLYDFGVLESNVHMAWTRAVCGRLGNNYRYSVKVVYNNFPWPSPSPEQKAKIEKTAQAILKTRAKYSECSFAKLYGDKFTIFSDLVTAHQENDRAVMEAYGFPVKMTESECVAELMKMYRRLTK